MNVPKPSTLHKLQHAPHHVKLRWLWIFSALAFAVVLMLWLLAFPTMVAIAPPATEANPNPSANYSGAAAIFHSLIK